MTTKLTVVVPIARSSGASVEHMLPLVDLFRRQSLLWLDQVDHLLVIDSGIGFDSWHPKVEVIHRPFDSHWANLWEGMRVVRTEYMLTVDSDTIIYDPEVLQSVCSHLRSFDIVAAQRTRFCPYFFACKTQLWRDAGYPSLDPTPGHDSMGRATETLLSRNPSVLRIYDPSESLIFTGGLFAKTSILDAEQVDVPKPKDSGWYHIRNAGLPIIYCSEFLMHNLEALRKFSVTPYWELFRLMAWKKLLYPHPMDTPGYQYMLDRTETSIDIWCSYLSHFQYTHPWIQKLLPEST